MRWGRPCGAKEKWVQRQAEASGRPRLGWGPHTEWEGRQQTGRPLQSAERLR